MLELLDYSSEDSVIPNIVNFLNEQGNTKEAELIGKCKIGKVSIDFDYWKPLRGNRVEIPILCTGDVYNILSKDGRVEKRRIEEAFETFFTEYYFDHSTNLKFNRSYKLIYLYNLTMKHIEPKESDLELFFDKVDKLKKLISNK